LIDAFRFSGVQNSADMNRPGCMALSIVGVLTIVVIILAVTVSTIYALREYVDWQGHPAGAAIAMHPSKNNNDRRKRP
jgi:hypothetical protein